MSKIRTLTKRRAVSPVIATVILVAVTITVAVAVSYWMSNITGQYTAFEKIEIQSGYSTNTDGTETTSVGNPGTDLIYWTDDAGEIDPVLKSAVGWRITIKLKNTGSAPSTVTSCFVNEKPIEEYPTGAIACQFFDVKLATPDWSDLSSGVTLESGTSAILYVDILQTSVTFTSGTTVNVKFHSAGGMDYIKLIRLS